MSAPKTGRVFDWRLLKRILSYTRPYRWYFRIGLLLTLLLAVIGPVVPWMFQRMIDTSVTTMSVTDVRFWLIFILAALIGQAILSWANGYLMGWLGQSVVRDIRKQVFNHITKLRLSVYDRSPVGMLQTRTISDVEALNDVFTEGLVTIAGELLQLTVILGMMFFISWRLTLVMMTIIPLMLLSVYIFNKKVKVAFRNVRKYVSEMNAFLQEHITGMMVTTIFSREKTEMAKFQKLNEGHRDAHMDSNTYYSVFFPVVEFILSLAMAILVWYGTGSVLKGYMTFGVLVAFLLYLQMFFRPIRFLAEQFNTLQMGVVSAERIFAILDMKDELEPEGEVTTIPGKDIKIEFDHVWFAYKEEDWILKDVSFTVQPGQKLALVGTTGSGKTTIISLLTRFYEVNKGEIRINGIDIKTIHPEALRKCIGLVLQDVFLFSGTVKDNITLNNDEISNEVVESSAEYVGAQSFIKKLPGGYSYNVQERGATLSTGQRQLISFARVLAYDPRILVLDEATSSIDSESEELIQNAIDKVLTGRTSIIIAHRLSTIQKADNILVMSKGKIVESGNHAELLAQNGVYRKLYELQFAEVV